MIEKRPIVEIKNNLTEYIHPKMDILFLALNAPEISNSNGHWFSRNLSFWNLIYEANLITQKIVNPLNGDIKIFGSNKINYLNRVYGVTDLNREQVETNSKNVVISKAQVNRILNILDTTKTKVLCIMHSKVAIEFESSYLIKRNFRGNKNTYGIVGRYQSTKIFEMPFHNAPIKDRFEYYKNLI